MGTEPGWAEAVQESKKHIAPGFYLELIVIVVVYVLHFFLCSAFSLLWEKETVFNSLGVLCLFYDVYDRSLNSGPIDAICLFRNLIVIILSYSSFECCIFQIVMNQ